MIARERLAHDGVDVGWGVILIYYIIGYTSRSQPSVWLADEVATHGVASGGFVLVAFLFALTVGAVVKPWVQQ